MDQLPDGLYSRAYLQAKDMLHDLGRKAEAQLGSWSGGAGRNLHPWEVGTYGPNRMTACPRNSVRWN